MSVYWKKIRAVIKPLLLFGLIQDSGSEVLFCIGLLLVGRLRGWRAPWAWKGLNEPLFFANFNCMACALSNEAYCCILVGQNPHYCLPSVICCPDLCPPEEQLTPGSAAPSGGVTHTERGGPWESPFCRKPWELVLPGPLGELCCSWPPARSFCPSPAEPPWLSPAAL